MPRCRTRWRFPPTRCTGVSKARPGPAILKDVTLRDGVIDVDVATTADRGFFGLQFRIADDGANAEWVYLRAHKSGYPDAMRYTPILNTG